MIFKDAPKVFMRTIYPKLLDFQDMIFSDAFAGVGREEFRELLLSQVFCLHCPTKVWQPEAGKCSKRATCMMALNLQLDGHTKLSKPKKKGKKKNRHNFPQPYPTFFSNFEGQDERLWLT
jgi:hypothetical protein